MQETERDLNNVRRDYGKMWGTSLGMSGKIPNHFRHFSLWNAESETPGLGHESHRRFKAFALNPSLKKRICSELSLTPR
jgi:hypothetical protein